MIPRFALVTFALSCVAACGGPERMQPPPQSTTTVTSAAAPTEEGAREGASGATTSVTSATAATPAPMVTGGTVASLNDAQIVTALRAASRSVLEQARLAVKGGRNAKVRELAADLLRTVGDAESRLDSIASKEGLPAQEGPVSDDVKSRGERVMVILRSSQGSRFDRGYLEGQVDELENLLELIDRFQTQADDEGLRGYLRELRPTIADDQRAAADAQVAVSK